MNACLGQYTDEATRDEFRAEVYAMKGRKIAELQQQKFQKQQSAGAAEIGIRLMESNGSVFGGEAAEEEGLLGERGMGRDRVEQEAEDAPFEQDAVIDDIQEESTVHLSGMRVGDEPSLSASSSSSVRVRVRAHVLRLLACVFWAAVCVVSLGLVFPFLRQRIRAAFRMPNPCPLKFASSVRVSDPAFGHCQSLNVTESPSAARQLDIFPFSKLPDKNHVTDASNNSDYLNNPSLRLIRSFEYNRIKFIFNPLTCRFETILNWRDPNWGHAIDMAKGISSALADIRLSIFGPNKVDIPDTSLLEILVAEFANPLFVFQVLCIIQWFNDEYASYAWFIVLATTIAVASSYIELSEKTRLLQSMCQYKGSVCVKRDNVWHLIPIHDLVPGDIFEISGNNETSADSNKKANNNLFIPCDAVLIEGSCIINESMLTGESKPVSKSPISHDQLACLDFNEADPSNSRHVSPYFLFYGTTVVRSKGGGRGGVIDTSSFNSGLGLDLSSGSGSESLGWSSVSGSSSNWSSGSISNVHGGALAMVVRTGVNTTKGCLIRQLLFPKPHTLKYVQDSLTYILLMSVLAIIGAITTIYHFSHIDNYPWDVVILRTNDLFTIVVPSALPATIAIGVSFSITRLRKLGIYCMSAARVNVCGQIQVMCFDKTGTLTHEGLDILGFRCVVPATTVAAGTISDDGRINPAAATAARFTRIFQSADDAFYSTEKEFQNKSVSMNDDGGKYRSNKLSIEPTESIEYPKIIIAMASCHSIQVLDGELIGSPMELKMFELSGWEIEERGITVSDIQGFTSTVVRPSGNSDFKDALNESVRRAATTALNSPGQSFSDTDISDKSSVASVSDAASKVYMEVGVVRSFEFVSRLRRMSVVTRTVTFSRQSLHFMTNQTGGPDNLFGMLPKSSKEFNVYCKGAPEVIFSLCDPSSVPYDYARLLRRYAHHGYHVIAIATKSLKNISYLKLTRLKRHDIESNLTFLGFLVFENKAKPETPGVVEALHAAKIRQLMCTGDNILTAISVARETGIMSSSCRIFAPRFVSGDDDDGGSSRDGDAGVRGKDAVIVWEDVDQAENSKSNISMQLELDPVTLKPVIAIKTTAILDPDEPDYVTPERFVEVEIKEEYQLAVTGEVFAWMREHSDKMNTFFRMLLKAQVFARMSPEQKTLLVKSIQELGYCVGFCGDGANDWGALQAADVGVSLSPVEISVAAPFTSKFMSISCIVTLIQEGRAALSTSFGSCKFLIVNGLIQFSAVLLLYCIHNLFITVPVAVFMSESGPHELLDSKRPTSSLASKKVMFSIIGQSIIQAVLQCLIFFGIRTMPFYTVPDVDVSDDILRCYENSVVFLLITYQYLFVALVYCGGPPYRENIWKNAGRFIITFSILLGMSVYITIAPPDWVLELLDLVALPMQGRLFVLAFAAFDLLITSAAEIWVFPLLSDLVGWAMIEYASLEDHDDDHDNDGDIEAGSGGSGSGGMWLMESSRRFRREKAMRRKWRREGKLYKIVEQNMDA
ncbi:hypothetical protein HK100_007208 [Physocladia obscura]|uniref:Cation-transporting ATPase n=1 Tax=Physocladia obscura TaxID=109957 RepID=A0AAD5T5F4_9FUNG|nr:hypothetical protein HK100_007208 [Physocladia obscura]